jgi:hypothetical protein
VDRRRKKTPVATEKDTRCLFSFPVRDWHRRSFTFNNFRVFYREPEAKRHRVSFSAADFEEQRPLTFPPFASITAGGAKSARKAGTRKQAAGGWAGADRAGQRGQKIA